MGTTPDQIATEIDQTRANLADDVDRLADHTSPRRIVRRRTERIRGAARSARDRVMGSAPDPKDKAGQAAEAVRSAPQQARRQVMGNPLAAGLVAFGVGALAATLLPGSDTEREGAQRLQEQGGEAVGPVKDAVTESAQRVKQDAQDAARDAGRQLGDTAKEAATTTGQRAKEAGGDVADRARTGDAGSDGGR
ncbi:MAG TPA: DUF3618 domain-containing protein [Streptosporangiales bacterium]